MDIVTLPEPIALFVAAVNRQDHATFLASFTDDGFVDDWGTTYAGRPAITQWSNREFLGAKGTLTPESASQTGDAITLIGDWRSSFANGRSSFRFDMVGNKIASMTIREG